MITEKAVITDVIAALLLFKLINIVCLEGKYFQVFAGFER